MFRHPQKLEFKFISYISTYWRLWVLIGIFTLLVAILSLINPYLIKIIVDKGIKNKDIKLVFFYMLIAGGIFLLKEVSEATKRYLEEKIRIRIFLDLNSLLYKQILRKPLIWFRQGSTGERLYKLSQDLELSLDWILNVLPQSLYLFPKLIFILLITFILDWRIGLFLVFVLPWLYSSSYLLNKKLEKNYLTLAQDNERIYKKLEEDLSCAQLIKAFSQEEKSFNSFLETILKSAHSRIQRIKLEIFYYLSLDFLGHLFVGGLVLFCSFLIIKDTLSLGTTAMLLVYLSQLVNLKNRFSSFFQEMTLGKVASQRLSHFLEKDTLTLNNIREEKESVNRSLGNPFIIEFKKVNFAYFAEQFLFKELSFSLKGKYVGICGPSGCGKTTIILLILKLLRCSEGEVFICGRNIEEIPRRFLRERIGVAFQEPFIWNESIKYNICYPLKKIDMEKMHKVSRICEIEEFVEKLPFRYETIVGEEGCNLSQGQKQKISLARALIKEPEILILDEALSSLDVNTEERIIDRIIKEYPQMSMLIVSYRLPLILKTEQICFFFDLNKILLGNPQELMHSVYEFRKFFNI
ncbi:MAG: ABC transporter ATP-binding protein/permease [Candidatus Omnitrophica bacterium]|nr:ABC transporter ATP-binding protein/permease [Candidatus Omnitrophota bacterium]